MRLPGQGYTPMTEEEKRVGIKIMKDLIDRLEKGQDKDLAYIISIADTSKTKVDVNGQIWGSGSHVLRLLSILTEQVVTAAGVPIEKLIESVLLEGGESMMPPVAAKDLN